MIKHCPTCRRESMWENNPWRPFCSERCQLIDLAQWASERYRIAGAEIVPASEPASQPESFPDKSLS
ncbi:MAG: DNA gyrase inhibitor YacG [Nitrospiraceae bacterium]